MISKIEALHYGCFQYINQSLSNFNVLFGPNGSGKTVFLDIFLFLSQLVKDDPESAVYERADDFQDLTWRRKQNSFELALEAVLPDRIRSELGNDSFARFRYQVALGLNDKREIAILAERGFLLKAITETESQQALFPQDRERPDTILHSPKGDRRTVFNKKTGGNDNYYSEVQKKEGGGWRPSFKLGPRKSSLGNLPEDAAMFPAATWLKNLLTAEIKKGDLARHLLGKPCAPGETKALKPDGSNLPLVIEHLQKAKTDIFQAWILSLQPVLPEIKTIRIKEQTDDRRRYLVLVRHDGLEIPSWMASEGTLRLLFFTLLAVVDDLRGIYIFENPEFGVFPGSLHALGQALGSVAKAQVFLSTHSSEILRSVAPENLLCTMKNEAGEADIARSEGDTL